MFPSTVIVFREVFEIAIIVTVILAATRQVAYRSWWVATGIAMGAVIVGIMACFASVIVDYASQLGQHVFHAIILFTASTLIAVSVIWMQSHGKQIAMQMKELSLSVSSGKKPLYMLAVVVALAVVREGSEIVLFLYGVYTTGDSTAWDIFFGLILGTLLGTTTGVLMYLGLIRIPIKQLFLISGWMLAFLSAGMVAKAVGHLVAAGYLPALLDPIWDTSSFLSQRSILGRLLSILVGYQDQPAGIQVIFYTITLSLISLTMLPKRPTVKKISS